MLQSGLQTHKQKEVLLNLAPLFVSLGSELNSFSNKSVLITIVIFDLLLKEIELQLLYCF